MKDKMLLKDFVLIDHESLALLRECLPEWEGVTRAEKEFLVDVGRALEIVNYEFAIPDLLDNNNPMKEMGVGLNSLEWAKEAGELAPEYGSMYGTKQELFIYYAYNVMLGKATLEELCDFPSRQERWFAVMDAEGGYTLCGGNRGLPKPYAATQLYTNPYEVNAFASWVPVLRTMPEWCEPVHTADEKVEQEIEFLSEHTKGKTEKERAFLANVRKALEELKPDSCV